MLLPDREIRREIKSGRVVVEPYDETLVQPSSIDVRLGDEFMVFDPGMPRLPLASERCIDPLADNSDMFLPVRVPRGDCLELRPGMFVLGSTEERIALPDDLASRFEGKSSLGRLGLLPHVAAGFIDPGFAGNVTLELASVAPVPIKLWPGMRIGQLCFFRMDGPVSDPYGSTRAGSHYQGQSGPTISRAQAGFESLVPNPA